MHQQFVQLTIYPSFRGMVLIYASHMYGIIPWFIQYHPLSALRSHAETFSEVVYCDSIPEQYAPLQCSIS